MDDTPTLSRSAKLYQERRLPGDRTTRRLPSPRFDPSRSPVHRLPLSPPFPTPAVLQKQDRQPPDAGLTRPWPYGEEEVTA